MLGKAKQGIEGNACNLKLGGDLCINLFIHIFADFRYYVECDWIVCFVSNDEDKL